MVADERLSGENENKRSSQRKLQLHSRGPTRIPLRRQEMSVQAGPTFRRPKTILPVPTPSPKFQRLEDGVPDSQLPREATGLLREFSTPLLFNHSHRVFFWANE